MILDGIILLILIIAFVIGYRSGLANTVSHLGGWLLSAILAIVFSGPLKSYLFENTKIDDNFHEKFVLSLNKDNIQSVPSLFSDQLTQAKMRLVEQTSTQLTDMAMGIFSFVIIFVGVKLIAVAFKYLFSKKHSKGIIKFTDGLLGAALGLVIGVIVVIALMAFAVPFAMGTYDGFTEFFKNISEGSILITYFYDYNILLLILKALG